MTTHLTLTELEAGLPHIEQSPRDKGTLQMIVARPETNERLTLEQGELDAQVGLVNDNWRERDSDNPDRQLTLINSRLIQLLAQDKSRWALAGDQLYVDLDLGVDNLEPGQQLAVGTAVIEITAKPHTGCRKFMDRFGKDALKFVNQGAGKQLRLRGIYAKVVQPGTIRVGDTIRKI